MSIDNIKKELFKLLSSEKESVYSSKDLEVRNSHNIKYDIYNTFYMLLRDDSSFAYVFDMRKKALNDVSTLEKKYESLLEKYEKESEKNKIVPLINDCVYRIDALNTVYNVINKNLKTTNNDYIRTSNKIIDLITKINSEKNPDKLEDLEGELYRLNEERRVRLSEKTDTYIIKDICELESLELRIANSTAIYPPYKLNRREFVNSLKDTIYAINEYYFLDYKKSKHYKENPDYTKEENRELFSRRFDLYVNKYYSLISSATNTRFYLIDKGNVRMSTDDLINYLSIYNLDGSYEIFRSKNKNRLIGNKDINRMDYQNKVEYLTNCINTLGEYCANKIKNGTVEIHESRNDKDELIKLRNAKLNEIDNIIEGEKGRAR